MQIRKFKIENPIIILLAAVLFIKCSTINFPATLMEMNQPNYLRTHNEWNKIETQHFDFNFSPKIDNDSLCNNISNQQEKNMNRLAEFMKIGNIDTLHKIDIWIFFDDKEKYEKTQVKSSAHSLYQYWSMYYNKDNAKGAHELGHLLSQHYWGYLKSKRFNFLLDEGFAFLVDEFGYFNFDFYKKAQEILQDKKYKIQNIIQENSAGNYKEKAFVSGAFLKYLISQYGIDKFIQLWKQSEEDERVFDEIYGKSFTELETGFYDYINKF